MSSTSWIVRIIVIRKIKWVWRWLYRPVQVSNVLKSSRPTKTNIGLTLFRTKCTYLWIVPFKTTQVPTVDIVRLVSSSQSKTSSQFQKISKILQKQIWNFLQNCAQFQRRTWQDINLEGQTAFSLSIIDSLFTLTTQSVAIIRCNTRDL